MFIMVSCLLMVWSCSIDLKTDNTNLTANSTGVIDPLAAADQVKLIKTRLYNYDMGQNSYSGASGYFSSIQPNGSWSDLQYDPTMSGWNGMKHLSRLMAMAVAYRTTASGLSYNSALMTAINKAINFWFTTKYNSMGFWDKVIIYPQMMGAIGLIVQNYASQEAINNIISHLPSAPDNTGVNKVWRAISLLHRGCLENSYSRIASGFDAFNDTLVPVRAADSIQPDWSYHFHGDMLYSGGYGIPLFNDQLTYAELAEGTDFAWDSTRYGYLANYMLQGTQWMTWFKKIDYGAIGREITRNKQTPAASLVGAMTDLKKYAPQQAAALDKYISHINNKTEAVSGNKYFWCSDLMVHRRANYYSSVRMCSSRTLGTESINGENVMGYWLPFGVTTIWKTGEEYTAIFPVWDWNKLPGLTAPAVTPSFSGRISQNTSFVGGVSDGTFGAACMDFSMQSTTAKKGYFFFENEMVCLGAGIKSTSPYPVNTAVNQCLLNGTVEVDGSTVGQGENSYTATTVLHDGVGYYFPGGSGLKLKNAEQSGTWDAVGGSGTTLIKKNVFKLWLEHGNNPNNATYKYIVLFDSDHNRLASYKNNTTLTIIANTASVQAVRNASTGLSEVIFYQAGTVTLRNGLSLSVDTPCALMLDENGYSGILTVANPDQAETSLVVTLKINNSITRTVAVTLPTGNNAGKSVNYAVDLSVPDNASSISSKVSSTSSASSKSSSSAAVSSKASSSSSVPTNGGCAVNYTIASDWGAGATISVTIKNNSEVSIDGWTLKWNFPGNQQINNIWSATGTQSGASYSAVNMDYNSTISANGGTVNFGFNIDYSGANTKPTSFTLNGKACNLY